MYEYGGATTVLRVGKIHSLSIRLTAFMCCTHNAYSMSIVIE